MKNKTRFTSLDVRYAVWELSETVEGAYLQNVYDVKNKTYLFKFSRRDQQKTLVLVEAGTRIHATAFDRANPNVLPSGFITRLRKYIRDRRVTKLNQVAYDRVIHFEFGHETRPDSVFNLYVELFASGNLILTDYLNKVLVLSRKVQDRKNNDLILDVGFHYDPYNSNPLAPPSTANAIALLCPYFTPLEIEYLNSRKIIIPQDLEKIKTILENSKFDSKLSNSNVAISQSSLKNILKSEFPSPLCEQILIWAEIPLDCKITSLSTFFSALIEQCDSVVNSIVNGSREDSIGGYILLKDDGSFAEFHPFPFSLYSKSQYQHFKTFCESVDSFYHKLEELATTKAETVRTDLYQKKFKAVQDEQLARMSYLSKQMEDHLLSARLIESNMDLVEQAIAVVRAGLDNEMRWDELEDLIIAEQKMGRRVAKIIAGLKLQKSLIVLDLDSESSLSDRNLNDSSNSKDRPNLEKIITIAQDLDLNKKICSKSSKEKHLTEVDIRLGGFANSKRQYELRRVAFDKLGRTQKAFDHAIKSAEAKLKSEAKLDRKQRPQNLISKRKPFWFEKFNWFISSDGFLVISGRDMHQNEHIVKNILRKGDAYLHADVIGASSVIVKAFHSISSNEVALMMNIPHRTLVEAGALSLCHSRAWEARIVTSAWWVHASQVSKSAPSGEYLSTGSFVIRGRKNYLPPSQLILGFGIMFVLDEEGTVKRRNARIERLTTLDTDNIPEDTVKYTVDSDSINDDDQVEVVNTEIIRVKQNNNGNRSKQQDSTNEVKKTSKINGKKKSAKDKKKALKYRDQDEEERQARMELLGSAAPTKTNFKFSKPKISSSQLVSKSSKPSSLDQVSDRNMAEDHPQSSLGEADKKSVLEVDHSNQKNISKISIGDGYICPSNVLKNQSIESDLGSDDEILGLNELSVVDSLTGSLSPEDVPINALCVAAPFVVTQHYRFRVKLLPGTLKRGAAAKTSMALMLSENKASMSVIERDLLKSIPDSELNMTMPGKVRIAASGVEISKALSFMLRVPGSALDSSPQNGPTIDQDFLEKISKDLVSRIVRERASAINELYELLEDGCKRIQYKQATWSPVASALLKAVSLENEVSGDHSSKRIQIMLRLFKKIAPFKFDVEEVIELISELCQTNIGLDILSCFGSLYVHGQMKKSKNTVSSIKIIVEIACECYKTSKTNFEFLELSKAIFSASTLIASLCDEHLSLTLFNSILTVIEFTNPNDGKENNVTHLLLSSLHQIMPIIKGRQSLIYYRIQNSSFLNGSNLYALHVSLIYDVIRIWIYLINPPSHFKSILDHALIQRLKIIDENPIDVASNSIIKFLVDHLSKLDVTNKSTLDRRVILLLTSSLKNQSFELVSFIDCITNMTISQQSWVLTAFANLKDDRLVQFALSSITRPRLAKFSQFYLYKCTPSGIFKSLLSLVDCKCSFKLILDQFRINFSNCLWSLNSALAYDKCLSNLSQLFTSENEAKTVIKFLLENMPAIIEFLRIPIINAETHPSILQSSHKFVQDSQLFISKNDPSIVDSAISFTVGFKTFKKNETKESIFNFLLDVPYERELASKLDLIISKYSPKINLCEYIWTNLKSINTSTSHFEIFEIGRIMSAILSELSLCDSNNSDSQVDQLLLQIEPIFDKVKTVKQGFSLLIDIFDHYASMEDSHFLESILKDCCDFVLLKLTSNNEDHQFKINILSFIVKHHSYIDLELLLNFFESIKPQALLFQSIHTCFMDSRATKTLALISEIPGHPSNRLIIDFVRFISMFSIELIRKSDPFELYRCFIAKTKSFSNSPDSDTIMRLALPNLIEVTSNPFDLNMKIADCLRDVLVTHPSELDLLDSLRLYLGTSSLIISYSLLDSLRVPQIILTYLCPNYVRFEMFVFWQIYQQQTTLDDLLADVELLQCGFASIIARISLLNHVSKQYITNMKATLAHNFVTLSSTLVFRSCAFALLIHGKETPLNFLFASIFSLLEISCPITENFETETGIMNAILAELLDIIREEPILKPFLSCICDSNPSFLNLDGPISKVLKNMLKDGPSEYTSNQNHGTYHNTSDLQTFMIESLEIHLFSTATFNAPISQIRHLFWIANFRSDKRNQDQKFPYLKFDRQILPTLSIAEKKALNTVEGRSRIVWKAYYSLNEALFPSKMLSVVLTDDSLVEFIGWRVIAEALLTSNDFLSRCVDKSDIKWSWHHLARALRYCVGKNFSASVNAEIFRSIWVDEITIKNMDDYPDHTGPHDSSTKVKEFPTEALYLLELSGLNDTKLYRHVYSNLNMSQYVKHIDSLSQTLPMFYSRGALEELSSASMMALQQWDMESFTDHVDVKELEVFTLIRNAYHSKDCNSLDKLNPGTIITKIAKESAIFIIKDGLNLKDLESNCIKMYIDEKNYKQASPLLWAHALESTSRWHQKSSQLDLLSKLAKADFFVHTGNSHMAQAVLNSAVKCVLKNTTEVSTLLSNRIFIGSAKLHWEGRTLPLNRIRIELINRIHLPHANSTWRENLNTQYRKSNTSDPESSNTAYFAARFFDDQYRELQETETSQLDMFHEELILYGKTAAINYATALHFGDRHDLCVFRLISIGLSLMSIDMEAASEVIAGTGIPTRKLLPLVFQLAARLGIESTSKSSNYECLLSRTLLEILLDHPHHVLYQLLSLANPANHNCTKSKMAPTKTSKRRIVDINGTVQDMDQDSEDEKKSKIRSNLALKIINTAKSICSSERLSMIVNSQLLCKAYTRAALHPVPLDASTTDSHPFPSDWLLGTICNLPVPVITLDIPVDHTLKYDNLPTIQRFLHESYRVIGGINMPKIVECLASDGRIFRQLIKGQDDLRQDAVMQQVFKLVNQIILDQDTFSGYITAFSNDENQNADFSPVQTSNKTLVRHLNKNPTLSDGKIRMNCSSSPIKSPNKMVHTRTMLRTYKVIPLQANAGVIEWVSDAQTLGNFLTTTHDEINKKTLTCREARAIMKAEFDRPVSNPISKYSVYANKIVPYFPPVLSKFFSQSPMNRSCADWLEMRQNYTQSVAISSVVGHVVGLGDRHCQNIMIDRKSGQILHIDLSMIFEAGTLLKIPELVPFRLTRDMVDGMGFLGLESSFKPIAEWTISLLRQKQNLLLTVLEAFEEDPLYKWPSFSSSRLKNSAIKVKSSAKYCLARVAQKLRGIEMSSQGSQFAPHGSSCILSPAGQIAHLVQIATDPERLAQMYPGWQSWM